MRISERRIQIAKVGGLAWLAAAILFFGGHLLVQSAWHHPAYSWSSNNISDLGQVTCALTTEHVRYVCSPLHDIFNLSVIAGGLLIIAGIALSHVLWRRTFRAWAARILLAMAALGWMLAGKYPFDVDENLHILGALLILIFGNIGLLFASAGLQKISQFAVARRSAFIAGTIGLIAGFLHFGGQYLGLGMGGMERIAVFPLPLWILFVSILMLKQSKTSTHSH